MSGLALVVGSLVVAVLAAGYFLMGMSGIHHNDSACVSDRNVNVTIEQPKATPSTPAAPRQEVRRVAHNLAITRLGAMQSANIRRRDMLISRGD